MQPVSPLPFLAVGLGIFALLGLGALYFHRLNKRLAVEAVAWFRKGASPDEVRQMLVARGIDAQYAADFVQKTLRRAAFDESKALYDEGASEAEVVNHLIKSGLSPEAAEGAAGAASFSRAMRRWPLLSVVAGVALVGLGAVVAFLGLILRDGNRTGRFVTFPYAGGATIVVGTCVASIGCVILYGRFTRTG